MNKYYIAHHGIKGQKWGLRRYQNPDGSLTPEGFKRYGTVENMERSRDRNKKIAIGVGVAGAVAGVGYLAVKNSKQKSKIESYKKADQAREAKKAAANAKRAATIASKKANGTWRTTKKISIPKGSDVSLTTFFRDRDGLRTDIIKDVKEYLNVLGGTVKAGG